MIRGIERGGVSLKEVIRRVASLGVHGSGQQRIARRASVLPGHVFMSRDLPTRVRTT
jgi:hypothetical protein